MNNKIQQLWPVIISASLLLGFGIIAFIVTRFEHLTFDGAIITFIQGLEHPTLTAIMVFFTEIGSYKLIRPIGIILLIFLYFVLKYRLELLFIPIVFYGARMLNEHLKELFQRERPDLHRLLEIGGYSFPSGHAMNAIAFYGLATFLIAWCISSRMGKAAAITIGSFFILMIGVSRIYLGVHYPSDVIAGYFASGFLLAMAIWITKIITERRHVKREKLSK